ncbi:type I restriction-modification system, DNA methylase subunit [Desulfuromonas soudanensis]|uniref:Type I restriction-modification system, DNA methylase subunit n=1 Tax=Desulfuromonas soudanensis TaxID=1603606 RepID=A0A0M3QGM5_9BACT|nr:N-6 DNA methylase [Desulfuromonas soudanensis]ALC18063.1 type I restriction-modification system, DNA methylase subunit [Desulfuromonas soudanensis]
MKEWIKLIEQKLQNQKNRVAKINTDKATVQYSEKIKLNRVLKSLTGDEEIVRAFLVDRLVNELDYKPDNIEIEKEYSVKAGHGKLSPRIDIIVKDEEGNPFFFIEAKAPDKFEKDKSEIEGQLFSLAQAEEKDFKTKVRYLVYYTADLQDEGILDKAIIIDFEKYRNYSDWENDGFISIGIELTAGYGEPKKQPLIKGHEKHDLRNKINREEIEGLGRNLHNVLWGGGGTNDSEIFYSLVNIILAKVQDEYEKEDEEEYDFQIYQYGNNVESSEKVYDRINKLYKRALKDQLNVSEQQKIDDDNVTNRNKFPLNKLIYTVQALENFSFLEGRSSLDGKDILGDFFETITRDGFKQNKGQFFTPTPIVNFLLYALQLDSLAIDRLNNDRELPLIIDPSAGSGTYLVEAMKLITKELKYKQKEKLKSSRQIKQRFEELFSPDYAENKWAREYLYGSEINFDLGTASKVNMILHGDGSTNIFVKDGLLPFRFYVKETSPNFLETATPETLYNDKEVNAKFDVAISNPPFSVDLDTQTQREVKNVFVFGDKRNSENLFIERYYQLLKEGGRLGVVLPESVFDTTENKYIRLFLFKYFNVKAIVSLPQITFEPFTSTKTSLLFAQKKTKQQVEKWNTLWDKHGKEWSFLKTRVTDYVKYFVNEEKINKKWAKDVVDDLEKENFENIKANIYRFLKDYLTPEDEKLTPKEFLIKYMDEIDNISKFERETNVFGFYNAWWVFGEVAKELDYDIFMAEAENIGYKRTKRGEKPMPNDLYDLEYAPYQIDANDIISSYDKNLKILNDLLAESKKVLEALENKMASKETELQKKKIESLETDIKEQIGKIENLEAEKDQVTLIFETYYDGDKLKTEYSERTDSELINHFKSGVLSRYKSDDIVLRSTKLLTILDNIRKEVIWE